MQLPFTKMHGLGNDFVVLDLISHPVSLSTEQIRALADRHFGIGFDQLLLVEAPTQPDVDFNYRIFNCDGGEVEHCGNGARCFARFVLDKGLTSRREIRVKTARGLIILQVAANGDVRVDMGPPDFTPASLPFLESQAPRYTRHVTVDGTSTPLHFYAVSMGNPHAVILVDDLDSTPVGTLGAALGAHPDFLRGVNVGFMQIVDRGQIRLRVFERGAGETQACGTGACAAVVCAHAAGLVDADVVAHLRGGDLRIQWEGGDHPVLMQGPAATVFEGVVDLDIAP